MPIRETGHFTVNTLGFSDVCQEVNQDLRVKRVRKNVGLGVKMTTMYERIDRDVCNDTR